jgi:hypothetical protein
LNLHRIDASLGKTPPAHGNPPGTGRFVTTFWLVTDQEGFVRGQGDGSTGVASFGEQKLHEFAGCSQRSPSSPIYDFHQDAVEAGYRRFLMRELPFVFVDQFEKPSRLLVRQLKLFFEPLYSLTGCLVESLLGLVLRDHAF